jgi:polysaccharide chain length determinant protein (PEP-CTERM system associated)
MQSWRVDFFTYLAATWRYRWQGLAAAWVVCLCGWFWVAATPNTYESVAEVYIDTNGLLNPLLRGLAVTNDPNQEIAVMLQTLLTDPTLERIVRATNPNASKMSQEEMHDAVASVRKRISLKTLSAKDVYSITYRDRAPAYAQLVAQTLVSVLIDTSLGGQRRDADQVGNFLDAQIANYQQKLVAADQRRAEFKTLHLDFFAKGGDRPGGVTDVVAAQAGVTQAQTELNEATDRRDTLRSQLKETPKTLDVNAPLPATMDRTGTAISQQAQLAAALARLTDLRTRYTESHPEVISQKRLVARLRSEKIEDLAGNGSISNPSYTMLLSKLADTETDVATYRNRLEEAKKQLERAKGMAKSAISLQREYENIDRDYQVLQKNYQELVARRESAKITQAAGDQHGSFAFRVISPPARPDRPIAPNRFLLTTAVMIAGIGAGAGLAFALGYLSGTFVNLQQLREAIDLPILGVVTAVRNTADIANARRSNFIFATGLSFLMIASIVVLYHFHAPLAGVRGPVL